MEDYNQFMNPKQMPDKRMVTIYKNEYSTPMVARKQNRNAPCSCGSGKKAKKCCGTDAQYFYKDPQIIKQSKKE